MVPCTCNKRRCSHVHHNQDPLKEPIVSLNPLQRDQYWYYISFFIISYSEFQLAMVSKCSDKRRYCHVYQNQNPQKESTVSLNPLQNDQFCTLYLLSDYTPREMHYFVLKIVPSDEYRCDNVNHAQDPQK